MPESNSLVPRSLAEPSETPEDVATLYSWANLHGAKYRDFSASRAEAREEARLRVEEAKAAEQRRLDEEAERQRQEEAQIAARIAAEAAEAARQAEAERLAEIALQAEAERQAVLTAQEAQRQAALQRTWQPPLEPHRDEFPPSHTNEAVEFRPSAPAPEYEIASHPLPPAFSNPFTVTDDEVTQDQGFTPQWPQSAQPSYQPQYASPHPAEHELRQPYNSPAAAQPKQPSPGQPSFDQKQPTAALPLSAPVQNQPPPPNPYQNPGASRNAYPESSSPMAPESGFLPNPYQPAYPPAQAQPFSPSPWQIPDPRDARDYRESSSRPAWLAPELPPQAAPAVQPAMQVAVQPIAQPAAPRAQRPEPQHPPAQPVSRIQSQYSGQSNAPLIPQANVVDPGTRQGQGPAPVQAQGPGFGQEPARAFDPGFNPGFASQFGQRFPQAPAQGSAERPAPRPPSQAIEQYEQYERYPSSAPYLPQVPPTAPTQQTFDSRLQANPFPGQFPTPPSAQPARPVVAQAPYQNQNPIPHEQQGTVDDTSGSRDRVANRWYALKSVFEPQASALEPIASLPPARIPVLAVFSLAGGVGKTSLIASMGRALSSRGERVLLVDTAAYGLLPFFFGARDQRPGMLRTFNPPGSSAESPVQLITLDPEGQAPESSDGQNQRQEARSPVGQDWLAEEVGRYARGSNRILVDLPTASGSTTRRVLRMNPVILVPVAPDMNSVVSVGAIESFFHNSNFGTGSTPILPYYILNQFDYSLPLHLDVKEILREQIGDRLLPFALRRSPAVSEALAEGMTVIDYAPTSVVAEDYANLAGWVRSLSAPAMQSNRGVRWSER